MFIFLIELASYNTRLIFSIYLNAEKKMMRKSISLFSFKLLMLSVTMAWAVNVTGQVKNLAVGGGVGFNFTPLMLIEGGYWDRYAWVGNFTPTVTVRYGNKISGVFKASYIRYTFEKEVFSQYGGTSMHTWEANIHQIHGDLLFEHSPFGSRGFFYYLGPGFGIPVKVKMTEEYWQGAWGPYPSEHTYEESTVPADFNLYIQGVFGIGGYIPVKRKT